MMAQRRGNAPMGGHGGFMAMGMPPEKARDFKGTLKRLLSYLQPHRIQLLAVFLAAVLSTVFGIVAPKILGQATTKLFEGLMLKLQGVPGASVDFDFISQILITLVVLYVVSALFSYLQSYIMASVAQNMVYKLRRDVDEKITRLPLKFLDSRTHGEILSHVTNDIDNISTTMQQSLTQIITAVITLVGTIIMMLTISPIMTLIAMVVLPASFVVTSNVAKRSQKYFVGQQQALGKLNGHVEEMYGGYIVVKAFGHEAESIDRFNTFNDRLYDVGWKAQFISGLIMPLLSFVNNIGYVLVCVVGGILVTGRSIAIGDVQAFIQYSRQFTMPITQVATMASVIQLVVASAERVFDFLNESEEIPDKADAMVIQNPRGDVSFENVKFGYKAGVPLIENMNIEVKQGQRVAIVGPTGAGKTTVVNLLMRFYEIDGGRITIDGVDIRDLKRENLWSQIGMVLQDTWLFNGTIRDNIAYGRENATEEQIVAAATAAHADHFIRTLPEGYDTILNQEISNISQGQKQLLTIARAVLTDPTILVLDEATSNVDTRTEILIQKAMKSLMQGRTSFVIAHRLSTIRDANSILVMNNGSIIEQGNHNELMAKGGMYADLFNSQFSGPNAAGQAVTA
ncbi:MAG: ABC transporter ATP-binding protein [Dehalococcoidia bacterium]|nr:ABC transporter ATP-binding protein [Dehalococcoidia bacterium]